MNLVTSPDDLNHSGVHLLMCSSVHPLMCLVNHSHDLSDRAIFLHTTRTFPFSSRPRLSVTAAKLMFFFTMNTQSDH